MRRPFPLAHPTAALLLALGLGLAASGCAATPEDPTGSTSADAVVGGCSLDDAAFPGPGLTSSRFVAGANCNGRYQLQIDGTLNATGTVGVTYFGYVDAILYGWDPARGWVMLDEHSVNAYGKDYVSTSFDLATPNPLGVNAVAPNTYATLLLSVSAPPAGYWNQLTLHNSGSLVIRWH